MKRNSTTLFLESPSDSGVVTTPVPWDGSAPVLDAYSGQTKQVLQKSWDDFVASGDPLEVIPDPPPETPEPDFNGFTQEFVDPTSGSYDQVYDATATKAQASTPLTLEHWTNLRIGLSSDRFDTVSFQNSAEYLNQLLATDGNPLTQPEKDEWMGLTASYNIPLTLS